MNKKIILGVLAIIVTLLLAAVIYFMTQGKNNAINELQNENPKFHTVEEGGACEDGKGDCVNGLTCVEGTCQTP